MNVSLDCASLTPALSFDDESQGHLALHAFAGVVKLRQLLGKLAQKVRHDIAPGRREETAFN